MTKNASRRPSPTEYTVERHGEWIAAVPGQCTIAALESQTTWIRELSARLSTEQVDKIHPPYAWTIRQVFEHCADAERVFGYRMMRFAAGDPADLHDWDENLSADSRFGLGNFGHLVGELEALREANLLLLRRLVPAAWDRIGTVDGAGISVRALAWLGAGHLQHHFAIVEKRCGITAPRTRDELAEATSSANPQ